MKITFVIDMVGSKNNGTTITAMRTASALKKLGHEINFIAYISNKEKDEFPFDVSNSTEILHIPLFQKLIEKQGFLIATASYRDIYEYLKGSDLVHIFLPFRIEAKVRLVAKAMGIPVTSAFHCQPENVSYTAHMGHSKLINSIIYSLFNNWLYKYTEYVHTPTQMMKDLMIEHHYKNKIYPISNGVSDKFVPMKAEKPEELKDKYIIMMCGRLSGEKRQDLIIKAIGESKYNKDIQLILCGQGPKRKTYEKLSEKYLANKCIFKFVTQEELIQIINYTDLYVHASDAESEAISCLEAISCGKVPVISDSKLSATNHFSLDPRCLFKAGDYKSLKEKIEYFYEHKEVVEELAPKYAEYGKTFKLENCAKQLEAMMEEAVKADKEDKENKVTYYSSASERRKLRRVAKKAGIENPYIFKDVKAK